MKTFESISIGQYYPAKSLLHELDPRVKIVLVALLTIVVFVIGDFYGLLFIFLFLSGAILLSRISISWILKSIRPLIFILIFTLFIHLLFTSGEIIFRIGFLKITREGLVNGFFIGTRLILLVLGTSLLTFVTTPIELNDGMEYLLSPFKKFKVPIHELSMMMTIALRFIPLLLVEADRILKAQVSRGADFSSRNFIKRAKNLVPFLIPLFVSVFRRAEELAFAMDARCYRVGRERTRLRVLKMEMKDWLIATSSVAFLVVAVVIGYL